MDKETVEVKSNWKQYVVIAIQLIMDALIVVFLVNAWPTMTELKLEIYGVIGASMGLLQMILVLSVIEDVRTITTTFMMLLGCGLVFICGCAGIVAIAAIEGGYALF